MALEPELESLFLREKLFDWREDFKNPPFIRESWTEDFLLKLGDCIVAAVHYIKDNYF